MWEIFVCQIQLVNTKYCLDKLGRNENRQIGVYTCHGHGYSQGFSYQRNGQIVFHHSLCLSLAEKEVINESSDDIEELNDPNTILPDTNTTNHVVLLNCGPTNGTKWHYDDKVKILHVDLAFVAYVNLIKYKNCFLLIFCLCKFLIRFIKSNTIKVVYAYQQMAGWPL